MKLTKLLLYGCFIAAIVVMGFIIWAGSALGPEPAALAALRSDDHVTVSLDKYAVLQPASRKISTALVFYPGARVDYRSYAAPLRRIAAEGYLVILLPVRLNLALFDVNAADRPISAFPEIRHWVVGGHSMGGTAAAAYAGRHRGIDGLVLWASYPANKTLMNSNLQILSVYGTLDMSGVEAFEASRANLPSTAKYVIIDGGNHAQFGDYGFQPGDKEAAIPSLEQQKQVVEATVKFLKEVSE